MESHNVIGIDDERLDRSIYRIMPVKYLYSLFAQRKNVLVRPKKWDDPFENFMLRSKLLLPTGEQASLAFHDDFYGQCWSTTSQSEALWRLYSSDKTSIRIRTTPRKLFAGLCEHLNEWAHVSAFVGKVRYFSKAKLLTHAQQVFADIDIPKGKDFAQTLLFKRAAFKHESEVRLLYFERKKLTTDTFSYPVTPEDIVEDIRLDPRLSEDEAVALRKEIKNKTGFKGTVKKSDLYDPPPTLLLTFGKPLTSRSTRTTRKRAAG